MNNCYYGKTESGLEADEIKKAIEESMDTKGIGKVLLIPPDFTRYYSDAGKITTIYYKLFKKQGIAVDIMPALGTHEAMTKKQFEKMFKDIPFERMVYHDWKNDVVKTGEVPAEFISEKTNGLWKDKIDIEINKKIVSDEYDLCISIGQVVPHEIVGMSNYTKNLFVGVGGKDMINSSHMIGAVCDLEKIMGRDHSPVREIYDYAYEHTIPQNKIIFVFTVTTLDNGNIKMHGLFIGNERKTFENAVELSQKYNIFHLDRPIKKCITYIEADEFKTTWLGNKAIYRTRMAMEDGGELIILAPGLCKFGEDKQRDKIVRKYGYSGRQKILNLFKENKELQENMSTAAHLIHGSTDGRFKITFAVKNITQEEIRSVGYGVMQYEEACEKYNIDKLQSGWNVLDDGEEIYYVPNPALGLWVDEKRFRGQTDGN